VGSLLGLEWTLALHPAATRTSYWLERRFSLGHLDVGRQRVAALSSASNQWPTVEGRQLSTGLRERPASPRAAGSGPGRCTSGEAEAARRLVYFCGSGGGDVDVEWLRAGGRRQAAH